MSKRVGRVGSVVVILAAIQAAVLSCVFLFLGAQILYTLWTLDWARSQGVYATPQAGILTTVPRSYCDIQRIEIEQAATNSFDGSDAHIWYVIWRVYARQRAPCDPTRPGESLVHGDNEGGGTFFLNTTDGWVMMPEGRFPELVGFWMKMLGLAGPGDPTHVPRN